MSTITEINSIPEWEQLLSSVPSTTLVIASFHAPWAAPCAQMATVLSTLASEYPVTEPPTTKWVSINAEDLSDLSETYDVTAVPFLVLLRNGQVVETAKQSGQNSEESAQNGIDTNDAEAEEQDPEKKKEELFKRLGDLVKAAPVMLFMKGTPSSPQCGFSRQLVGLLRDNSVKYGFFNILADDEVRQGLKEFADWPTYPQLWIDGELVGGLDIVKEEMANDAEFLTKYSVSAPAAV
ncbi:glutaredoxin [Fusarium mundagurra]|uniref:Glutaredoxin n=1 Tax=Fusarium mundagurra TaxID=1567541 RepID=A0A8H5YUQ1_9HYPO|nr:glutaredoxin [Fusarium mundagurra]